MLFIQNKVKKLRTIINPQWLILESLILQSPKEGVKSLNFERKFRVADKNRQSLTSNRNELDSIVSFEL